MVRLHVPLLLALVVACDNGLWPDTGDTGADDTGDTDDTGPLPIEGVTGLVEFTLLQIACPGCFGVTTDLFVEARAAFHPPATGSWATWMPAVGTCAFNPTPVPLSSATVDRGAWVYLESGSQTIPLRRATGQVGVLYESAGLDNGDYLRNASWSVFLPEADDGGVRIEGGLVTTEGFSDIQPWELLYVSQDSAFAPVVARTGQTFTWAPAGGGDRMVVAIDAYDGSTGAFLGSAQCAGADSGAITVPGSVLSAFPGWSLLSVGLYRYRLAASEVPDGSTLESISWVGVLGTATLVP